MSPYIMGIDTSIPKPWDPKLTKVISKWFQGKDLNLRPSGYEPDELPLLYPGI
jgi:hypothetical protein